MIRVILDGAKEANHFGNYQTASGTSSFLPSNHARIILSRRRCRIDITLRIIACRRLKRLDPKMFPIIADESASLSCRYIERLCAQVISAGLLKDAASATALIISLLLQKTSGFLAAPSVTDICKRLSSSCNLPGWKLQATQPLQIGRSYPTGTRSAFN